MRRSVTLRRSIISATVLSAAGLPASFVLAAAQTAPTNPATAVGAWDMLLADTARKCRLTLREDAASTGKHSLGMPAGCRRALPILMDVAAWDVPANGNIVLNDASGQAVLTFAAVKDGELKAQGPEGETYELVNTANVIDTVPRYGVTQLQAPGQTPGQPAQMFAQAQRPTTAQRAPTAPQARTSDIVGRYAVIRENNRDTGCMVTLSEQSRGRGMNRAQLAPACRDQGIVIFDPQGWHMERGQLVLHARKGHKAALDADGEGQWMKKDAKPLGLKRL